MREKTELLNSNIDVNLPTIQFLEINVGQVKSLSNIM